MDHAVTADADYRLDAARHTKHRFGLPLVSVIVVNYNYGRFLIEAVESIVAQTYPHIEIIIADDASTDDSASVLDRIEATYPQAKIIRRTENGGQSLASRQGFEASSGDYVAFLDADDILLPDFVATHVFVHLSVRVPVGFSSSDMAQASGSRIVTSMLHHFGNYVRSGQGRCENLLRRIDEHSPELWPLADMDEQICDSVHLVDPTYQNPWVWAPTSGNLFRRDALTLFFDNDALANLRSCTDAYLVRGVAVLNGSVLIDRTLSIYRLHGANSFSQGPHLNGTISYDRGSPSDNDQKGRRLAIDHLIAKADVLARRLNSPFHYLDALKALNDSWPLMPSRTPGCRSYVGGEIVAHFRQLAQAIGLWPLTLRAGSLGVSRWMTFVAFASAQFLKR
jgi:glycosyltransferase involved in cell wall biosynthesis